MKTKEAQKEYQRKWVAARRSNYMLDKICARCEGTESLNVHHKDRTLKISHNIWSWSEEKRNEELKKCEVLCRDCHVKHHKADGAFQGMLGVTPKSAKLNSEIVLEIRRLKSLKISNTKIGLQLKIPRQTIDDVVSGKSWSWVQRVAGGLIA
jgi:hypothetical protein